MNFFVLGLHGSEIAEGISGATCFQVPMGLKEMPWLQQELARLAIDTSTVVRVLSWATEGSKTEQVTS